MNELTKVIKNALDCRLYSFLYSFLKFCLVLISHVNIVIIPLKYQRLKMTQQS